MRLKVPSAKWRPFCPGLNVLNTHVRCIRIRDVTLFVRFRMSNKNIDVLSVYTNKICRGYIPSCPNTHMILKINKYFLLSFIFWKSFFFSISVALIP